MNVLIMTVVVCLTFIAPIWGQGNQAKDARFYRQQAAAAFKAKDYAAALAHLKKADALIPNHPSIVYNLAVVYAALGNPSAAVQQLDHLAAMGLTYAVDKDASFAAIKDTDEFQVVLKKLQANKTPVVHSQTAFTVDEKGLIVESVAYDPNDEVFYVSSVHKRKILRLDHHGTLKTFASEQDGLWSVLGLKVDAKRRHLWAVSSASPQMTGFTKEADGSSGIFKFDLQTGKLIKKYLLPNQPLPHALGDLLLNARGDVYASDSRTPAVYKIDASRDTLELFLEDERFVSPQGLTFADDESQMFLADYSKGIFKIDLKTKQVAHIPTLAEATFLGIDGLYFYKGALIAIQNGINPHRVARITLSKSLSQAEKIAVLEVNNPVFDEPTLGVIVKDEFYFVANSQYGSVNDKGELAPAEKLQNTLILKLNLR